MTLREVEAAVQITNSLWFLRIFEGLFLNLYQQIPYSSRYAGFSVCEESDVTTSLGILCFSWQGLLGSVIVFSQCSDAVVAQILANQENQKEREN